MRKYRRLVVVLLFLFISLLLFFRLSAPEFPVASIGKNVQTSSQTVNQQYRDPYKIVASGIQHKQPFAYSALRHLATSLSRALPSNDGGTVLFVASDTQTASKLSQIALDLALEYEVSSTDKDENGVAQNNDVYSVHFLFIGSYSVDLEFFSQSNRLNASFLHIHDGRPRLNQRSPPLPIDYQDRDLSIAPEALTVFDISPLAVRAALEVSYRVLRPSVTIWSRQSELDDDLGVYISELLGAPDSKWAPIDLPAEDIENLRWLSFLEPRSLKSWSLHEIDIVIVVTSHSGSLIRLLDDLAHANYYNHSPKPRITVYLPPGPADPSLVNYIERTLKWPKDRIVLQSTHKFTVQQSKKETLRDGMHISAIRSYVPSSKKAHVVVLADTVRLSKHWFHWMVYSILKFSPDVRDTEMTANMLTLAGINICGPHEETTSYLPSYFLSQSLTNLSCTMFFPPHFRVLQSYMNEQLEDRERTGSLRTLQTPLELEWLKKEQTDAHSLLLPIYIRGYVFIVHSGSHVPGVETAFDRYNLEEQNTGLLDMPLHDYMTTTSLHKAIPKPDDKSFQPWQLLPAYPDRYSNARVDLGEIRNRGERFANLISPECNVHLSLRMEDGEVVDESEPALRGRYSNARELADLTAIPSKIHDDWSDIFCVSASNYETSDSKSPKVAKTLEELKREQKKPVVVREKPVKQTKYQTKTATKGSETKTSESTISERVEPINTLTEKVRPTDQTLPSTMSEKVSNPDARLELISEDKFITDSGNTETIANGKNK
ncbi:hypothetical protein V1511DRAFT_493891 [Dipodascopsis uninucleata]